MARLRRDFSAKGVYDRGSSWQVRIKRQDAAGHIHRINRTFPYDAAATTASPHSRAAVFKQAAAFAATERAALHVEKRPASDLLAAQTLGTWLERYENDICPRKKGGAGDARICRLVRERFPRLCARPVQKLTSQDFGMTSPQGMGRVLDQHYMLAPATIVRNLAIVSHVFTVASEEWHFPIANPVQAATRPSVDNERNRVLSAQEWTAVGDALTGAHVATRAAIAFLRWTACRRSEAVKLRWEDVRLDASPVATFKDTKTPKTGQPVNRTIPLPPEAVNVLRNLLGDATEPPSFGPVFTLDGRKPIQPDSLTQAWERACKKAGVVDATLHDLRHTRTTELANLLPLQKVMRLTGHKTPKMLMRYYNPKAEDLGNDLALAVADRAKQEQAAKKRNAKKSKTPA